LTKYLLLSATCSMKPVLTLIQHSLPLARKTQLVRVDYQPPSR